MKKPQKSEAKTGVKLVEKKSEQIRKGPEPERIKFEGGWVDAVDIALKVKRPPTGWPK